MPASPVRYAKYSIAASLATMVLKFGAWSMTGSVGLLSDAVETLINLAAGIMALYALLLARRPPDSDHTYGHGKVEYLSSGVEGVLILVAATGIVYAAVGRFLTPAPLESLGLGLGLALAASLVNFVTARAMLGAAKRYDSLILEADAKHLLTDVWTSVGLVAGLAVILVVPSWKILDPIIAVVMAVNIAFTGWDLLKRAVSGLMDNALPEDEVRGIQEAIVEVAGEGATWHGMRTRKSGTNRFLDFHLLVDGRCTVKKAHDLCCDIEDAIRARLPGIQITCHVEPREDGQSWDGDEVGGLNSESSESLGEDSKE